MTTESENCRRLAEKILDRPHADPDDDLAVLARGFKRKDEQVAAALAALKHVRKILELKDVDDRELLPAGRRINLARVYIDKGLDLRSDSLDAMILEAQRAGFDLAIDTDDAAARKAAPELADALPLVIYFANETDRDEMIASLVRPDMVQVRVPKKGDRP